MLVERFLGKYGGQVFTVHPEETVATVARKFGEISGGKRYSVAVVCEEGDKVVGVVSLGDITWAVGRLEEKAPTLPVRHIMTEKVQACSLQDTLDDVLKRMAEHGIRHMPVVEDGRLKGLVARREALEFMYQWAQVDVDNLTGWLFSSHARY